MSLKLITTLSCGTEKAARVYRDVEWDGYRVKFYNSAGQHLKDADYHTDTKNDAEETARHYMSNQADMLRGGGAR